MNRVRSILMCLLIASAMVMTGAAPAHAYKCEGPVDPVCVATQAACIVARKVGVDESFCQLG